MKMRVLPGINIQTPWANLLINGEKIIETRTYRMPAKYNGVEIAVIETPGRIGQFKARIIGTIVFGPSYEYNSQSNFIRERSKHLVEAADEMFGWPPAGTKWAWPVLAVTKFSDFYPAPRPRGIVFASNCEVPELSYAASSSSSIIGNEPASSIRVSIDESIL